MGDSSVSCVLSGMTLTTQKAVLIALAPASFYGPSRKRPGIQHGARVIGGEGNTLQPVLLPIFGRMDSYGRLHEIEKNAHTEFLQKKLDMSIDSLAESIVLGEQPVGMAKAARKTAQARGTRLYAKEATWDGRLFGCFVDREIWNTFSVVDTDDVRDKPQGTAWDSNFIGPEKLVGVGFEFVRQDIPLAKERLLGMDYKRYSFLYRHPDMDVDAWCDDSMHTVFRVGGRLLQWDVWSLADVQKQLNKSGLSFTGAAIAWAKSTSSAELVLRQARRELNEVRERHARSIELERKSPHFTFYFQSVDADGVATFCDGKAHVRQVAGRVVLEKCPDRRACEAARYSDAWFKARMNHMFPSEIIPTLTELGWKVNVKRAPGMVSAMNQAALRAFAPEMGQVYGMRLLGSLLPQLAKLLVFTRNMRACNRLYQPTEVGYQYGHLHMQRRLAQMSADILSRRIKSKSL